jgi:hypothetical protein
MSHTTAPTKGQKVTSNVTAEAEIARIKRENQNIIQNLSLLESEERIIVTNKSEQLKHLAKNYERLAELGEYKEPVDHICATICRELTQRNMWASVQQARAVLDKKYKQEEFTPHNLPSSQVELDMSVQPVDINNNDNSAWQSYINNSNNNNPQPSFQYEQQYSSPLGSPTIPDLPLDQLPDDKAREIAETLTADERKKREALLESRRRAREAREYCQLHKIPLSPEYATDQEPHVSAISPDSGPSEAYYACLELEQTFKKLGEKLFRWRPPQKLAEDLKLAFEEEVEFYKTFVDEKYRECQPAWWVVQINNLWHGKHAAAIMAACPIDEKTKRSLTREQVGDRQTIDLQRALRFAAAQKAKAKCWWWFHEMNRKGIAKRAKELNPVLSEKSFT